MEKIVRAHLSPEQAKKYLSDSEQKRTFRIHLGASIRNLYELAEALDVMDQSSYDHHVTKQRNDFGLWIADVVGDQRLAKEVSKLKLRTHIRNAVLKRIHELEVMSLERPCRSEDLRCGAKEFLAGIVIGIIIGMIIRTFL